jgi:NAD(P)-dependent dehydrogenase (short-subunit alcohol dehydrogenase family)
VTAPKSRDALLALLSELELLAERPLDMTALDAEERKRFMMAAGKISSPTPGERKRLRKALRAKAKDEKRQADDRLAAQTGIREARRAPVFATPARLGAGDEPKGESVPSAEPDERAAYTEEELHTERKCYVCKRPFATLHHFYDQMCGACGDLNWQKRQQTADLRGRVAVLTGARVKIGYHAGIKLLRAGAHLIASTRFPRDAAARYAREPDYTEWKDRLDVIGLDLRHTPSVERFAKELLERFARIDYLVQNACQTVRRPPGFYQHLVDGEALASPAEHAPLLAMWNELRDRHALAHQKEAMRSAGLTSPEVLSQIPLTEEDRRLAREGVEGGALALFPAGELDADLQQRDLRGINSWRLRADEVPTVELLEVQLVNAIAPFVLAARLRPAMKLPTRDAHVVNVSAMEGQFYRAFKTDRHPHTNMAKAALNMLTRTSAADYVQDGIHMNSVDTGWITDEDPFEIAKRKTAEHGFHPPLDVVDGAARILDPIFDGVRTGRHAWGLFLKDYARTPW